MNTHDSIDNNKRDLEQGAQQQDIETDAKKPKLSVKRSSYKGIVPPASFCLDKTPMIGNNQHGLIIISVFDGIGAAFQWLKRYPIAAYISFEIDDMACAVLRQTIPSDILHELGNVTDPDAISKIMAITNGRQVDVFTCGSPCTDLSVAKAKTHRTGLKGKESGLLFDALRIFETFAPTHFVFENVASMSPAHLEDFEEALNGSINTVGKHKIHRTTVDASRWKPMNRKRHFWTDFHVPEPAIPDTRSLEEFLVKPEDLTDPDVETKFSRVTSGTTLEKLKKRKTMLPERLVIGAITRAIGRKGSSAEYIRHVSVVMEALKRIHRHSRPRGLYLTEVSDLFGFDRSLLQAMLSCGAPTQIMERFGNTWDLDSAGFIFSHLPIGK